MSEPLIIERTFNAPIEKVWKAITDRDEMSKWYFDLAVFKPEVGFKFRFTGGKDPERLYMHLCEITEVIPSKKLTHSWRYDGYPGNSFVTFELFTEGERTRLRLTHSGLESFAASNNPDLDAKNFFVGWNAIIGSNLQQHLES